MGFGSRSVWRLPARACLVRLGGAAGSALNTLWSVAVLP